MPIGEPKQLVRSHTLASSRPGSPSYLSYRLAAADHRAAGQGHRPDATEEHLASPQTPRGSRGARGSVSHTGQETSCTHLGLCTSGEWATTNVPRLYNRAQHTNSYDGELGSSMTCAWYTYVLGSFSNPPLSLIVAYR